MAEAAPRSAAQTVFAWLAVLAGTMSLLQGGMRGRSAGWEEMALRCTPDPRSCAG